MANQEKISNVQLYIVMCLMLFFGTCNTIIMKLQDQVQVVNKLGEKENFNHPYF